MQNLSFLRRLYYGYLSYIYQSTYWTSRYQFLGLSFNTLIRLLSLALVAVSLFNEWSNMARLLALLLAVWINFSYWHARRAGYKKFLANETAVMPGDNVAALPRDHHIKMRASGVFTVREREEHVLLQPAEYWQVPAGEHVVMVEELPGRYLYQFFNARSLQEIKQGWLLFGIHPQETLSITFLAAPPSSPDYGRVYYAFLHDEKPPPAAKKQTIYLTFDEREVQQKVWHNIVDDARRARMGNDKAQRLKREEQGAKSNGETPPGI